jgi:hypothetical protein
VTPAIWVAIIGALVSVGTLFYNQRSQRDALNMAILAEIQRLLAVLESHRDWWKNAKDRNVPLIPLSTPVFDEHEQDIGLMDAHAIARVVNFYGDIKFINALQNKRSDYIDKTKSDEFDQQYLRTLSGAVDRHKGRFDKVFGDYGLLRHP